MTDNSEDGAAVVETWRGWIIKRMLEEVSAGRDPGSVDDVKAAAEQARRFFEEQIIKSSEVSGA